MASPRSRLRFRALALLFVAVLIAEGVDSVSAGSPTFVKTWGGKNNDSGRGVAVDSSGNIIVTGESFSFGSGAFLLKFSSQGNLLWQKSWTGSNHTVGRAVAANAAGDIYLTGSVGSRTLISKISSSGAVLWQKSWGVSTQGYAVAVGPLDVAYITGSFSFGNGTSDLFLLAFSSSGLPLWQRTWGGNTTQAGDGVIIDGFGNIFVTGATGGGMGGGSAALLKFNATGSLLWQKVWRIGGSGTIFSGPSGIALDTSGNVYISGGTYYSTEGPTIGAITKLAPNGTLLWQRSWPGAGLAPFLFVFANAIASDPRGNVFVTGEDQNYNIFLLELTSDGGLVSAMSWGVNAGVSGNGITLDNSGTPIVVGSISKAPSCCTQATTDHTLSTQTPIMVTPTTFAKNMTDLSNDITLPLVNANGSTTYAGGTDVFLNFGSTLPIPSFSPIQLLFLGGLVVVAGRGTASVRRVRSYFS